MVEITRTETVGEDGVLRLELTGLTPGRRVQVAVLDVEDEAGETADSNPDVEDFA